MSKESLRTKYRQFLNKINDENDKNIIDTAGSFIAKYHPKIVAIYIPQNYEIDMTPLMTKFCDVRFAAPKMKDSRIFFVHYGLASQIERNTKFTKYYEPVSNNEIFPDMIFVPGVAFDIKGGRLGLGQGHYDKYLAHNKSLKIGVCRAECLLERLPTEKHDQKMDYIITQNMVLDFT